MTDNKRKDNKIDEQEQLPPSLEEFLKEDERKEDFLREDLLSCLAHIARTKAKEYSKKGLTAGLPLENGKLTLDLFFRALKRVHLTGDVFQKPLSEITDDYLPCVLLLTEERACYVEGVTDKGFWIVTEKSKIPIFITLEEMQDVYAGFCIFIKPLEEIPQERSEQHFKDHWLWGTLYKFRSIYYQVIIASLLTNIFSLLIPLYSMNVYDRVLPNNSFSTLYVLSIGIFVVMLFDFILKIIKGHFVDTASKNADIVLSSNLLERILGMKLSDRTVSVGELASHVKDLEVIREFFSSITLLSLIDIPFAVLFLVLITFIGGYLFLIVALVFIFLTLIFSWIMQQMIAHYAQESFQTSNKKSGYLIETILGIETLKAFGAEGKTQHFWENLNEKHATSYRKSNFFSSLAVNFIQNVSNLNYIVFVIVGAYLFSQHSLSMGGLIACSILGSRAIAPFAQAISLLMRLNGAILAYRTIDAIMNIKMERGQDQGYFPKEDFKGHLAFKNVSFKYPNQLMESLKNVSFYVEPKDKLAILGRIGSGKSTIEKILLGFYPPTSGTVLIDDIDSHQIDPADFRSRIGYVSQDIYLFSGTILENIVLGQGNVSPQEIEKAIIISGAIHFIKHHPQGVHMQVGEGGRFLSGGQKQTIGIARALLHNPQFLIFDEPTTMMDQQLEQWFLSHFREYIADKTVIVISHNPSILALATKILLLDEGVVKFFGTKADFIERVKREATAAGALDPTINKVGDHEK